MVSGACSVRQPRSSGWGDGTDCCCGVIFHNCPGVLLIGVSATLCVLFTSSALFSQ